MKKIVWKVSSVILVSLIGGSAQALIMTLPANGSDIVGSNHKIIVQPKDTLETLSKAYDLSVHEILEANPQIRPPHLEAGSTVVIKQQFILPKPRRGIIINLAELRLYYFPKGQNIVMTYPIGIGRLGWQTPQAEAHVTSKEKNPTWTPPASIKKYMLDTYGKVLPDQEPAGPNNPLGTRAIRLSLTGYLIHGTSTPDQVGKRVSSGCIRMYNHDIEQLFDSVKPSTPVKIMNEPHKVGWANGNLYLESHVPLSDDVNAGNWGGQGAVNAVQANVNSTSATLINWQAVQEIGERPSGIPTPVTRNVNERMTDQSAMSESDAAAVW